MNANGSLTVRISSSLARDLKLAAREDGREPHEEMIFLLWVMLAVCKQKTVIPLKPDYTDSSENLSGFAKVKLDAELSDSLFHLAAEYGLRVQELMRLFWASALDFRKRLGVQQRLIRKEEFVRMIVQEFGRTFVH